MMFNKEETERVIRQHEANGRYITIGEEDPLLTFEEYGKQFEAAQPGIPAFKVKAKHFLQEEQYEFIAQKVKEITLL